MKNQLKTELKEAFYWFHKHPELSFKEYETTAKIKELLQKSGIELLPLPLETGVVAIIRGLGVEEVNPVVAIRCDIDGLPINEETELEYASCTPNQMHACGHDFHIATILGAAQILQNKREKLKGTVKVIFQPAEESSFGALKIIETGELQDVQAIFGIHAAPSLPVGTLGIREGSVTAAVDRFHITVTGCGCHAAHPDDGIDPIVVSAAIIMSIQSIVSRNLNPFSQGLVSITKVEGGSTWNVIPRDVTMEGTVRTMTIKEREWIPSRLRDIVEKTAAAYGASAVLKWIPGPPATNNHPEWTNLSIRQAQEMGYQVEPARSSMGGEDFAFYQEIIDGCFIKVGTGVGPAIHQPKFQVDPEAIMPAACYIAELAQEALTQMMV